MKKSRKRLLISSVAMLLVAMLALGTATFAWFTQNTTATADGLYAKTIKASTLKISKTDKAWTTHVAYGFGTAETQHIMYPASHAADGNWYNCVAAGETAYDKNAAAGTSVTPGASSDYVFAEQLNVKNDGDTGSVSSVAIAINYPASVSSYIRVALVPCDSAGTAKSGQTIENNTYAPSGDSNKQLTNATTESDTTVTASSSTSITVGTGTLAAGAAEYFNLYIWFEGQDSECYDTNAGQTLNGLTFTVTGTPAA
ncbi:hypothetical protein [Ruminococcus difficilis]|uniref:SipW-cognate class signal peptide n=1 Tax=Ruminococcus difficilis TaxID=2763069 RepID=A0A934WRL7_9FIRM|nr:hypothetical protein [Ruminococcus difficilis]MBK6088582.1 hypothetical protein [Ruminococcus difficilis]